MGSDIDGTGAHHDAALAFFYGGMVRKKNILSTLNLSFIMAALIGVQWVLYGYSLAFGHDIGGVIGDLSYLGFAGVGQAPSEYAATVPHLAFAAFQMMFAILTPALITGALSSGCASSRSSFSRALGDCGV